MKLLPIALTLVLGLAACSADPVTDVAPIESPAEGGGRTDPVGEPAGSAPVSTRVDPRRGGLEVGLGEWALTLEAGAIRPGEVTFVVVNRGTVPHGFEIEAEDGDSSGHGSGDGLKAETRLLQPGERTRLTLNLGAGRYKVECLVDGHDDLGMEGFLEVRTDAPFVRVEEQTESGAIAISGFAFDPPSLEVLAGTSVTWTNEDPAPHTVTAEDGFDSGTLEPGQTFTFELGSGAVAYVCQIHPEMRGELVGV